MSVTEIRSPEQACEVVRGCAERASAVLDYGVAHDGMGYAPPEDGQWVRYLGGGIEPSKPDLTVRCGAGVTFDEVTAALREEGQWLPIDSDGDLTLGEIVAHNVTGSLRVGFNGVRDLLLGLSFVDGRGELIHVGGRTVKNVAGYDVSRLMVGSMNQFGMITSVTFKTFALPSMVLVVEVPIDDLEALTPATSSLLRCDASPAAASLHYGRERWQMRLAYMGDASACRAQFEALEQWAQRNGLRVESQREISFEDDMEERAWLRSWLRTSHAVARIIAPPTSTGRICERLADWAQSRELDQAIIQAMPTHGVIWVGGKLPVEAARQLDELIELLLEPESAARVWLKRCDFDAEIAPFAPPQPDRHVLADVKRAIDPKDVFNPGRYVRLETGAMS